MSNPQQLYDIQGYTDVELYDILDLVNPSDRVLEAKILMEIHKYENINTKSACKLAIFFDEIYNHFFESEDDVVEGFEFNRDRDGDGIIDEDIQYTPGGKDESIAKEKYKLRNQDARDAGEDAKEEQSDFISTELNRKEIEDRIANATSSTDFLDSFDAENAVGTEDITKTERYGVVHAGDSSNKRIGSSEVYKQSNFSPDKFKKPNVGYTQDLEYSRGRLNPILQQTTKRIISIDSQYRGDKRTFSTDFTFNLSEPLKDVVSLKLYSVQIPYTWYTIGKAYGNNFFYFKGRTPGIDSDSGLHDIKIEIAAGNYSPVQLIGAVNGSINIVKGIGTDISMGNTSLTYSGNTSITTAIIDLKKSYNESSYVINFDEPTIPAYLGFIATEYDSRTIRSSKDIYDLNDAFTVTENNNYFTVNVYQDNSTTIDNSFDISISPGEYTRETLITQVKTALSGTPKLMNTDCSVYIDSSGDNTYIDMSLQLSRTINGVTSDTKTEVVFYDEQHYTVDFTGGIFSGAGRNDISGNIGDEIIHDFDIQISPQLVTTPDALLMSANSLTDQIDAGTYIGLSTTTNGSGTGAIISVVALSNKITSVTVTTAGSGYEVGDTLTVAKSQLTDRTIDLVFTLYADDFNVLVVAEQLICKITKKFHNGTTYLNYNGNNVEQIIQMDNPDDTAYSLTDLYEYIETIITNYTYNSVKLFADSTISAAGVMILKINADDKIWVDTSSCFGFEKNTNMLNEILGETEATEQSGTYTITTTPYVYLTPNLDSYNDDELNGINDLSFSVPKSGNYNLTQYIAAINNSISTYDLSHKNVFNTLDVNNNVKENSGFDHTTAYPDRTQAYLQNEIFQMYFDMNKVFDESMYQIDLSGSIFDNSVNDAVGIFKDGSGIYVSSNKLTGLSGTTFTSSVTNAGIAFNSNTIIFTLQPIRYNPPINGNEKENDIIIRIGDRSWIDDETGNTLSTSADTTQQVDDIINLFINPALQDYKDPISGINILKNISVGEGTKTVNGLLSFDISVSFVIKKTLVAKNYDISFKDTGIQISTWKANLKISGDLIGTTTIHTSAYTVIEMDENYKIYDSSGALFDISGSEIDSSGNILDISRNILESDGNVNDINDGSKLVSGRIMYTVIPNGNVKISGIGTLTQQVALDINRLNNTFSFNAIEDGVATTTKQNDVNIVIPVGSYYRDQLISEINLQLAAALTTYSTITGTKLELMYIADKYRVKIVTNIAREYGTSDFNLVFFDNESFATCVAGGSSVQNTTWDTTIGWIMGFREYTTYDMSADGTVDDTVVDSTNGNELTILGDTGLSTNLYNYFLICLDDFNQSHLNDGLVTITNSGSTIPLPSYANRSNFVCDPVTGEKVYSVANDNVTARLTEKQIYATQVAANSASQDTSIGSSVSANSYGTGPFVSDVFGLIPIKVSGLAVGSSYVEFGGTLQNQERSYFGPVNISRMSVKLVTDRGNLVDLNKANWSFSLVCESLNRLEPGN